MRKHTVQARSKQPPASINDCCTIQGKDDARASLAILALYIFFFVLWCAGLLLGIFSYTAQATVWGLPLWFVVSCLGAYIAVFVALIWVARRYFS